MRTLLLILTLCIVAVSPAGSEEMELPTPFATYHLGFSLSPAANTVPHTCAVLMVHEGKIIRSQPISTKDFLLQASGQQTSKANPDGVNMLEEFEIGNCSIWFDEVERDFSYSCNPVTNLWRLRYDKYPVQTDQMKDQTGWSSKKYIPSDGQLTILNQYGIHTVNQFTWGDNAFRLLRDVSNPAWVASYKGS